MEIGNEWNNSHETTKQTTHNEEEGWNKSYNKYLYTKAQRKRYKGLYNKQRTAETRYNSAVKKGFKNPYKRNINGMVSAIENSKFEYDVNRDALYNRYKQQYMTLGNEAMQDAQAEATANTGGYANSYAATAGQMAYNSYMSQLQSLVPTLYGQARTNFDNRLAGYYNQLNMYQGLNSDAFNQYQTRLNQLATNRDYYYKKANDYKMSTQWTDNSSGHKSDSTSTATTNRKGKSGSLRKQNK